MSIIEYFWDYFDIFQTKTINSNFEINSIHDIPVLVHENKIYKPIFMSENEVIDDIKTYFVYCNLDDCLYKEVKNYKSKLTFNKIYDNIYLIPDIFRMLHHHCIKNRLPLDNYHIVNNVGVNFEVVNAKPEEYKMIKYILLKLLNIKGFIYVDIKTEDDVKTNYARMLKNLNEINYIR